MSFENGVTARPAMRGRRIVNVYNRRETAGWHVSALPDEDGVAELPNPRYFRDPDGRRRGRAR